MCPRAPRTRAADDGLGGPAAHQVCVDSSSAAAAHADDLRGHRTMAVSRSSWNSAGATPAAASGLRSLWLAPRPVSRAPRAPDATAHSRAAVAPAPARVCPSNAESECVALASLARAYRITSRSTRGLNCYSPTGLGQFDVVLFLGVLYHLRDPLLGLERVASVTRDLLILETVIDLAGIGRAAAAFYP